MRVNKTALFHNPISGFPDYKIGDTFLDLIKDDDYELSVESIYTDSIKVYDTMEINNLIERYYKIDVCSILISKLRFGKMLKVISKSVGISIEQESFRNNTSSVNVGLILEREKNKFILELQGDISSNGFI